MVATGRGELQVLQQHIGAPFQAFGAIQQGTKALRERDAGQLSPAVDAGYRAVGPHKELRIGQPCLEHPLIAP